MKRLTVFLFRRVTVDVGGFSGNFPFCSAGCKELGSSCRHDKWCVAMDGDRLKSVSHGLTGRMGFPSAGHWKHLLKHHAAWICVGMANKS